MSACWICLANGFLCISRNWTKWKSRICPFQPNDRFSSKGSYKVQRVSSKINFVHDIYVKFTYFKWLCNYSIITNVFVPVCWSVRPFWGKHDFLRLNVWNFYILMSALQLILLIIKPWILFPFFSLFISFFCFQYIFPLISMSFATYGCCHPCFMVRCSGNL